CLSGCFNKPQAVAYRCGAAVISAKSARISASIRDGGRLPTVSRCVPLAGRVQLSTMWTPTSLRDANPSTVALCRLSLPGFPYGPDHPPQHEPSPGGLVLGGVSDDDRQAGYLGAAAPTQLGLRRYETAWMLLHKLRRGMVNVAREPLYGDIEV